MSHVDALAQALRDGHLEGAAVDVYPTEPEENTKEWKSVLQGCPNTIITPRIPLLLFSSFSYLSSPSSTSLFSDNTGRHRRKHRGGSGGDRLGGEPSVDLSYQQGRYSRRCKLPRSISPSLSISLFPLSLSLSFSVSLPLSLLTRPAPSFAPSPPPLIFIFPLFLFFFFFF